MRIRRGPRFAFALALLLTASSFDWAQDHKLYGFATTISTWTGRSSGMWSDPMNWSGGVPTAGSDVVLPASVGTKAITVDVAGVSVGDVDFIGNSYDIGGSGITVTGNIANRGQANRINADVAFSAGQHLIVVDEGGLRLRGTTTGDAGTDLSLVKTGLGTLAFDGTAGPGTLTVDAGDVLVLGDTTLDVEFNGSLLTGTGRAGAVTVNGGLLQPGPNGENGVFTMGDLRLEPDSAFSTNFKYPPAYHGEVAVEGDLVVNGAKLMVDRFNALALPAGSVQTLASATGTISGRFAGLLDDTVISLGSQFFRLDYDANGGHAVTLTVLNDPTPDERFIDSAYLDLLNRFVDPGALPVWVDHVASGARRLSFVSAINTSTEYRVALVHSMYRQFLRREPDGAGLLSFVAQLNRGVRREAVIGAIVSSAEYFQTQGGATADGFVNALYRDLLWRDADPAGFGHFRALLNQGTPRADVVNMIIASPEHYERAAFQLQFHFQLDVSDQTALGFYRELFRRGATFETVINFIVASPGYYDRAQARTGA